MDRGAAVNDGNPGGESVFDMAKRFSGAELQRYLAAKVRLVVDPRALFSTLLLQFDVTCIHLQ